MKSAELMEILGNAPAVYAIFRVVNEKHWLVKTKRARIGEEFAFARNHPEWAQGPFVPGTCHLAANAFRTPVGDIAHWEFVEYRVSHRGDAAVFLYEPRQVRVTKKR